MPITAVRTKSPSENRLRKGESPILLRSLRKIGTVPDGSRMGSKLYKWKGPVKTDDAVFAAPLSRHAFQLDARTWVRSLDL